MNNDFGVGVGVEAMAAAFELGAEFGEIVNLAVENDPCAAVFVEDGLMASGEIDDAEAAHAEASAVGDVKSLIVGAAVNDLVAHVVHESFRDVALASCAHHASDSTHGSLTFQALRCVRENWRVPPGLRSFFPLFPALKRWAKLVRPSGAAFSSSSFHRIAKTSVLTHTLKRCATQKMGWVCLPT